MSRPRQDDPLTPEEEKAVARQGEYIAWQLQVNREIAEGQDRDDTDTDNPRSRRRTR